MPWTEAQKSEMLESHWANKIVKCPTCSHKLTATKGGGVGSYFVGYSCPGHGEMQFQRHNDPRKDQFKEWTNSQIDSIFAAYDDGKTAYCPNDGTPIHIENNAANTGDRLHASCDRCGKFAHRG